MKRKEKGSNCDQGKLVKEDNKRWSVSDGGNNEMTARASHLCFDFAVDRGV